MLPHETESTFADGFGNWHALVSRERQAAHILVARRLILEELVARDITHSRPRVASSVKRTPLWDTDTHLAFGEVPE